jgi:putative peptidoglycan lipid II flippase
MDRKKYLSLSIAVAANFILQFFFQWYILKVNGATSATDALFGAMALPQFILMVLSASLTIVLIPILSNVKEEDFKMESWNFVQIIGIVFLLLSVALFFTSATWVRWILPGFKGSAYILAVKLSNIQLIAMLLSSMLSVLWAVHSAKNNFLMIETTSIAATILSIIVMIVTSKFIGIYAAAWALVLKNVLQFSFLIPILGSYHKPTFKSENFKKSWKRLQPLIAGNIYYKTDVLVDRYLMSNSPAGSLTLFNLGQQIYGIGSSIFTKVFINTIVPRLATLSNKSEWGRFNQLFTKRLLFTTLYSIVILFVVFFFGKPVFNLVFSSRKFTESNVNTLWLIMIGLGGYWIGGMVGTLTSNTFYSKGNTVTPTIIGVILFTIYLPMKFILFAKYHVYGLVFTISVYYIISLVIQLFFLGIHFSFKFFKEYSITREIYNRETIK